MQKCLIFKERASKRIKRNRKVVTRESMSIYQVESLRTIKAAQLVTIRANMNNIEKEQHIFLLKVVWVQRVQT